MEQAETSRRGRHVKLACKQIVHSRDREAWLRARGIALGASESSTVMGLNPYESEFTLFQRRTGRLPGIEDNERMEWGRRLEALVAEKFAEDTGRAIRADGWMLQSIKHPWLSATPDFLQRDKQWTEDGLLEIKTGSAFAAEDWRDEPPVHYQCQLQHQMLVTGLKRGSLAVLLGGQSFLWKDIDRHTRFIATLVAKTKRFWQRLQDDEAPLPDDSPSTSDTLLQMIERGEAVQLPDIVLEWHVEARKAADDEKAAKERKDEYRRKILAVLGQSAYGVLPGEPFGCNGLYKCLTEVRAAHSVPETSSRVLRFKRRLAL